MNAYKNISSRLLLVIFFIAISGLSYSQVVIDRIIAKVDNQIVLSSELEVAYLQFMSSQENSFNVNNAEIKCHVLETLLINKMLLAKAEIDSVTVDDQMIEDNLNRRMQYFIQYLGSEEKLEAQYGKTIEELKGELRKQVRDQMVTQKMQDKITGSVAVTPAEIKKFFNTIPKDSLPYFSTEVEIGQIVVIPEISKEQKNAARMKLVKLREQILNGEDFCILAKYYSEDPGSAPNCGELGYFEKGQLVEQYEQTALRLQPGEISEIVESQFGFHLIQFIDRNGTSFNTRHILIKPASSTTDVYESFRLLDSIRTKVLQDSIGFEQAAKKFTKDKATSNTGGMINGESGGTRIAMENIDPAIYFIIDTMKVGSVSMPVLYTMEDGTQAVRIIYYKSKLAPHQANMIDDYQKIQTAALEEKKATALNKWFDKAKQEVYIDVDPEYSNCKLLITN